MQFTADAEQTFKAHASQELLNIAVVRIVKTPLADLEKNQMEVTLAVQALGVDVESQINVFENQIELFVVESEKISAALEQGLLNLPDNIVIIPVESMGTRQADIYGGLSLSTCTSGFSVIRISDNVKGVTTAAHCSNSQSYSGSSLTFVSQSLFGSYDVQWHKATGFTVLNKVKDGANTSRNITSTTHRNNQAIGAYVCKYGMTSGYSCGYISSKTVCPSSIPSCSATFIRVDNSAGWTDLSSGGDSGGPWFFVNSAYGTHIGEPASDLNDALYMAVNYINGLGVYVMTSP